MNVRRIAPVALFPLVALSLAACAVAPADGPAEKLEGAQSSAMLVPFPPPVRVVSTNPVTACSTTPADVTLGYPAEPGVLEKGTSNASSSCDWFVTEVDGVQDKDIFLGIVADPQITVDQASCQASTETFATYGWVPAHGIFLAGSGDVEFIPGAWESIATQTLHGVYVGPQAPASGEGDCAFNAWVDPASATGTATGVITYSPYSIIRVATQAVYTNGVTTWRGQMGTYVVPRP